MGRHGAPRARRARAGGSRAREGFALDAHGAHRRAPAARRRLGRRLMLYHLLVPLSSEYGIFNVFRYITFRTGAATLTALFLAFMVGPPLIRALARLRVGQVIREVGPAHQAKAGTPTMGGLLILLSTLVSVLLWSNLDERGVWILMGLTVGYGVLGFIDDYAKVTKSSSAGVSARTEERRVGKGAK